MKRFEDELSGRFSEATSTEGVDQEALWRNIDATLPQEPPKAGWWPWLGYLSLGAAFLLLGTGLLWQGQTMPKVSEKPLAKQIKDTPSPNGQDELLQKRELTIDAGQQELPAAEDAKSQSPQELRLSASKQVGERKRTDQMDTSSSNATSQDFGTVRTSKLIKTDVGIMEDGNTAASESAHSKDEALSPERETAAFSEVVAPIQLANSASPETSRTTFSLSEVSSLPILPLLLTTKKPTPRSVSIPSPRLRPVSGSRFQLGVYVGTNLLLRKYASEAGGEALATNLNASRGNAIGQSVALELNYRLTNQLRLTSGIEYARTHNTFRYVEDRDTMVPRADFPGQTVRAIARRSVAQNNFQTSISIPLLLDISKSFGDFDLGVGIGVRYHILLSQSGKLLNQAGRIVSFDDATNTSLPTAERFLSYQVRPTINYRIRDELRLVLRTELQYQPYGTSALFSTQHNGVLVGGSLGLSWGL